MRSRYRYRQPKPRCPRRHPKVSFEAMFPKRTDSLCRCGCGEKLEGRQTQWRKGHEKAPLEQFEIAAGRSDAIRRALAKRDEGVCQLCGLNTLEAMRACGFYAEREAGADVAAVAALRARFMALGFPPPGWGQRGARWCQWWEAHHLIPVADGGPNSLENLVTVCLRCHKKLTREYAAERAQRRKTTSGQQTFAGIPPPAPGAPLCYMHRLEEGQPAKEACY